jgi:hypothetical protein
MMTISFKLEEAVAQELDRRAASHNGSSRHTMARQLVIDALADANHERVLLEFADLKEEIEQLRGDLATAVVALLVKAGKVQDPKEAQAWVSKALLR